MLVRERTILNCEMHIADVKKNNNDVTFSDNKQNLYQGLMVDEILRLMSYKELGTISNKENVFLVQDSDTGTKYVKKFYENYNLDVYKYFWENPVRHMPKVIEYFKGDNGLWVIEEYIEGISLEEMLCRGPLSMYKALYIARSISYILSILHSLEIPIIHRDIKPSNIILTKEKGVYLLDINISKFYDPNEKVDTILIGTPRYAAPEQAGFGTRASSDKTDIYQLGVLLNVMVTGKFINEQMAAGELGEIVGWCTMLEQDERCCDDELTRWLESMMRHINGDRHKKLRQSVVRNKSIRNQ